jgi:hypothetical protein
VAFVGLMFVAMQRAQPVVAACNNDGTGQWTFHSDTAAGCYTTIGCYCAACLSGTCEYTETSDWNPNDGTCTGSCACQTGGDCSYCGGDAECACICAGGYWDEGGCGSTPLLVNTRSDSTDDHLTSVADGVRFDINATGRLQQVAWTRAESPVGFLVLDRNGDGTINNGSELFGTATRLSDGQLAANGFDALKEFDTNGDGRIDAADPVFTRLRLWFDANHNGRSEPDELMSLQQVGVKTIFTKYSESRRVDRYGNWYRYRGSALLSEGGQDLLRRVFDVILVTRP